MKHSEKVYIVKQALTRALKTDLGRPFHKYMRAKNDQLRTPSNLDGKLITPDSLGRPIYKSYPREMPPVEAKPKINVEDEFLKLLEEMKGLKKNKK